MGAALGAKAVTAIARLAGNRIHARRIAQIRLRNELQQRIAKSNWEKDMLINQGELANLTAEFWWGHAAISHVLSKFEAETETRPRFPCIFGQNAVKRGNLRFLLIPYKFETSQYDLSVLASGLRTYIAHTNIRSIDLNHHCPLLVLFEPITTLTATDHFKKVFIEAMQFLLDEDHGTWPAHVSKDPAHHTWTMCFDGCELFVNVSHPGHVLRKSRNLGPGLAFVINPRKIFDIAAPADRKGRAITATIRRNIDIYDDVAHSPLLGSYLLGETQWPQYMIPDNNEEAPLECPLHFK
ncbi:YqcI/YcgG family protein [Mesorhizobium sp. M0816]|uniref:YqcI/YcgG family protein n=1 Tax=Mesorhizobium sp. M0816 TaxID=2957006 RepID=UPI00333BE722